MATFSLTSSYDIKTTLALSVSELKERFLFGIPLITSLGERITDTMLSYYISLAQQQLENYLSIKLRRQTIVETRIFTINEWYRTNLILTTFPIVEPFSLTGTFSTYPKIKYDRNYLQVRRMNDDLHYSRNLVIYPYNAMFTDFALIFGQIPYPFQYIWEVTYLTGFKEIPLDIYNVIGKLASIFVLTFGDVSGSIAPGISSSSISLDGLSQSVSSITSKDSSLYSPRISQYSKEIEQQMPLLRDMYRGLIVASL